MSTKLEASWLAIEPHRGASAMTKAPERRMQRSFA